MCIRDRFWPRASSQAALASIVVAFPLNMALSFVPGMEDTAWMPALAAAATVFVIVTLMAPATMAVNSSRRHGS